MNRPSTSFSFEYQMTGMQNKKQHATFFENSFIEESDYRLISLLFKSIRWFSDEDRFRKHVSGSVSFTFLNKCDDESTILS